jgi:hypothetical protein
MPRETKEAIAKTEDGLDKKLEPMMHELVISSNPVIITGVQRKINIGNYETIDVYCAISMPQDHNPSSPEELATMVKEAAEIGFMLTSKEVSDRYEYIKESKKG